ncbi:MAG: hypothetical protein COS49_02130 [Candidatus Portnoybacteria bacterium CG03_land_8_20_14_0_80_41_10]|uniref:Archease domain-containing protein n=1 Tax=Candidatus Portnoybacteria bacterium CG03_land_8_20_14_0_80_41_10 TaxID=1974808 RepID=A0A2M7BU80_9BACT|nr:MAG: hypothetical protein COS49_02130 [Candidatus Portnoybacteria bacterium CG03_land_8_20_14_0_80_41_10]
MKKFELLEHRADLKIKVKGSSKEELFLNALLGMEEGLRPETKETKEEIKREIRIKSIDLPALLIDFLSEVLYLIQVNKETYHNIEFKKFADTEVEAELLGQKVERFGEDIKAVTYHQLDVHQRKDGTWEVTVLFDV